MSDSRTPSLLTTENLLSVLFPLLQEALVLLQGGRVHMVNPAAENLFGVAADKLRDQAEDDLLRPAPGRPLGGECQPLLARAQVDGLPGPMVSGTVLGMGEGASLWVIKGPAQLCQIGSLTAGLAHNLASPLSLIRNTTELLERYLGRAREEVPGLSQALAAWPPAVQSGTRAVVEAVDRVSSAVSDLLAKIRGEADQRRTEQDINRILSLELSLLRNDLFFKHEVELDLDLASGLPQPLGLFSDFSHALGALLSQAVGALQASPRKQLKVSTSLSEGGVEVRIAHTGKIESEPAAPGQAQGLGHVRHLLEPWGGKMRLESQAGWSAMVVTLPAPAVSDSVG